MNSKTMERYPAIIGSDEAGKGEWLGPMTIAAVALSPEQSSYLVTQGVMDSKELKIETVMELANIIKKTSLSYHTIIITPERFNKFLQEVRKEGKSLNDILAWGHAKAIGQVSTELGAKGVSGRIKVIIDEFDKLKTEKRLRRVLEFSRFDVEQYPKAEEITAVAAAGILARAERELWIDRESRHLHLELRKISAAEALTQKNPEQFAKVSFLRHG